MGGTLNLSTDAVAGATYSWTGPNGFTSALQNPEIPNVTAAHAGTYSLTVSFENCSSNAGSTNVVITPIPVATPSNLGPYCEGNPIQLRAVAVAGASYLWTYPNGNTSTERNHNILNSTVADAGTYRLTITINGCTSAEASTEVIVNPRPAAPAPTNNGPICAGETLQLFANAPDMNYHWIFPDGSISIAENPIIQNATTAHEGSYSLRVSSIGSNTCESSTISTQVIINAAPALPAASSPNQICINTTIQPLTASGTDLKWYNDIQLLNQVGTDGIFDPSPFIDISVAGTHNFYVTQTIGGCTSPARTVTVSIIDGQPAPPTAEDIIVCNNQNPILTATGENIQWYYSGLEWSTENPYELNFPLNEDTEFLVTQRICDIESEPTSVWIRIINSTPQQQPIAALENTGCGSFNANWSAVTGATNYRYDVSTQSNFMEWFLKEQIEEEYIARRALELFDVIGEEGVGRYMIDKKIPGITYNPE